MALTRCSRTASAVSIKRLFFFFFVDIGYHFYFGVIGKVVIDRYLKAFVVLLYSNGVAVLLFHLSIGFLRRLEDGLLHILLIVLAADYDTIIKKT